MAEVSENPTLRMPGLLDSKQDTPMEVFPDLTGRIGSIADQVVGAKAELSGPRTDFVRLEHRTDRLDERLLRIERRLDPIEA